VRAQLAAPAIFSPVTRAGRYILFSLAEASAARAALSGASGLADGAAVVFGLGQSLLSALGAEIAGLKTYQPMSRFGLDAPSTPAALWCWIRGDDPGEVYWRSRAVEAALSPAFESASGVDAFRYREDDFDLSGYRDGVENPQGDEAVASAVLSGRGEGLDGASFVVVQQWLHDVGALGRFNGTALDAIVGRKKADESELETAPPSAHVRRTDQESFSPAARLVRRSMPWADGRRAGLMFVAFGRSLEAFEAQWARMTGLEDGIVDALFRFSRPISGAYFWCPPVKAGRLDLRALGVDP
jgi:porphyrinogen peroxidase